MSDGVRALIRASADSCEIRRTAVAEGMRTIHQCAVDHVLAGRLVTEDIATVAQD